VLNGQTYTMSRKLDFKQKVVSENVLLPRYRVIKFILHTLLFRILHNYNVHIVVKIYRVILFQGGESPFYFPKLFCNTEKSIILYIFTTMCTL